MTEQIVCILQERGMSTLLGLSDMANKIVMATFDTSNMRMINSSFSRSTNLVTHNGELLSYQDGVLTYVYSESFLLTSNTFRFTIMKS